MSDELDYANADYDMDQALGDQPDTDFLSVNSVEDGLSMTAVGAANNLQTALSQDDPNIEMAAAAAAELGMQAVGFFTDPIGALVSNGLDFLIAVIQPLEDILGFVTGNPDRLQNAIERWSNIQQACFSLAQEVQHVADAGLGEWDDEASVIAKQRISELADAIGGIGVKSGTCQHWLGVAQLLAQTLQEVIKSIISNFISQLIVTWLAAIAAAAFTFGASTAAATSWTALMSARNIAQGTKTMKAGMNISKMLMEAVRNISTDLAKPGKILDAVKNVTAIATATANNQTNRTQTNHSNASDGGADYSGQDYDSISGAIHS